MNSDSMDAIYSSTVGIWNLLCSFALIAVVNLLTASGGALENMLMSLKNNWFLGLFV